MLQLNVSITAASTAASTATSTAAAAAAAAAAAKGANKQRSQAVQSFFKDKLGLAPADNTQVNAAQH